MRIGINALYLIPGGVGGTEVYLRSLLAALAAIDQDNSYVVFTGSEARGVAPAVGNFREIAMPAPSRIRPVRILEEQTVLPWHLRRCGIDVLLNAGFTAPALCPCPQVTVFHDLQHKRHAEYFRWWDLPFWNLLLWQSAVRSGRLIAVSEATRRDLLRFYGKNAEVVRHGVAPEFAELAERRSPEPFLLCVSTLHPHKNIDGLVRAFARFHATHPGFRLVLAGMRGFHAGAVERAIVEQGLSNTVHMTGWISDAELKDLYRRAWGFVYPSRFEGFGMPVLEAMSAGVPVACSDIAPLREIADGAALFFPPGDIGPALERLCCDEALRGALVERGRARAREFTWGRAAEETLAVLRRAVEDRGTPTEQEKSPPPE